MLTENNTDISNVFSIIDDELKRVKDFMSSSVFYDMPAVIRQAVHPLRDSLFNGKMLRPALVILSHRALKDGLYKKTTADLLRQVRSTASEVIRVAAVVELIHNATLLHDDVIDEGQKRRGVPTMNSLLGNESAVLLGDFLLSKVFRTCADLNPAVVRIISVAAGRTCEGELSQIIQRGNWQLSEPEYLEIITEKSAALFSGCCQAGAVLAGADKSQVELLGGFGLNLGVAFQITDDLLDIIGYESKAGKTLGSDAGKSKPTLALIHLLGAVREGAGKIVIEKLNNPLENKDVLLKMLETHGSLEYARNRAKEFTAKAIEELAGIRESDAREALIETARFVAGGASVS
jgi:octaprenyl-diphosphate synthase